MDYPKINKYKKAILNLLNENYVLSKHQMMEMLGIQPSPFTKSVSPDENAFTIALDTLSSTPKGRTPKIKRAFYPKDPPGHAVVGSGTYGYYLTEKENNLLQGYIGRKRGRRVC